LKRKYVSSTDVGKVIRLTPGRNAHRLQRADGKKEFKSLSFEDRLGLLVDREMTTRERTKS